MPGSKSQRWESTTWKMSPAAMYSLARRTLARNFALGVRGRTLSLDLAAGRDGAFRREGFHPAASLRSMEAMSRRARW